MEQRLDLLDNNIYQQSFVDMGSLYLKIFLDEKFHPQQELKDLINSHKIKKILRRGSEKYHELEKCDNQRVVEIGQHQHINLQKISCNSKKTFRKLRMMNDEILIPITYAIECPLSHFLDSFSHEFMKSRENQWKKADALYKSEDVILRFERSKVRDVDETKALKVIDKSLNEMEELIAKDDSNKKRLKEEGLPNQLLTLERLSKRKKAFTIKHPCLPFVQGQVIDDTQVREDHTSVVEKTSTGIGFDTQQISTEKLQEKEVRLIKETSHQFQNDSSSYLCKVRNGNRAQGTEKKLKIRNKDSHIRLILRRSSQLLEDRQILLLEMEDLLSKAKLDNEKLRNDLTLKDYKLNHLYDILAKTTLGLALLVSETDIQKDASNNIEHVKEELRRKERELEQSKKVIESMAIAYENLLYEREMGALESAKLDHTYEYMLQLKNEELNATRLKLLLMKKTESQMYMAKSDLEAKLLLGAEVQYRLRHETEEIANEYFKTIRGFERVKSILMKSETEEGLARTELENFLADVVDRAETVENDYQQLKIQIETEAQLYKLLEKPIRQLAYKLGHRQKEVMERDVNDLLDAKNLYHHDQVFWSLNIIVNHIALTVISAN